MLSSASFAQWYYFADGTCDFAAIPTIEGNNVFKQDSVSPGIYWEIASNGEGGKCLRHVDMSVSECIRWRGYGSRPEFYRGPCNSFTHENFRPDHKAFTLAFRLKAEYYMPSADDPVTKNKRLLNLEFETTISNPLATDPKYPYYMFRVEPGLQNDTSGKIWIADFRTGDKWQTMKTPTTQAEWHTVWVMCDIPPDSNSQYPIYRVWVDGVEKTSTPKVRGGWSDFDLGMDGEGATSIVSWDYLCWTYGAYLPGQLPIPSERTIASENNCGKLKSCPDGTLVELPYKTVTGVFIDPNTDMPFYYIEESDGSCGIKIAHNTGKSPINRAGSATTIEIGDVITVSGAVFSPECEKQISAHEVIVEDIASAPVPRPVAMSVRSIQHSFDKALYNHNPSQILFEREEGTFTSAPALAKYLRDPAWIITDSSKNWTPGRWANCTLYIPRQGSHNDLCYYIITNSENTLVLGSRVFLAPIDPAADGVILGENYEIAGGERYKDPKKPWGLPMGITAYGLNVRVAGRVTYVNTSGCCFDIDDGTGYKYDKTLYDIWDYPNYAYKFSVPKGIRVYVREGDPMPAMDSMITVTGCVGNFRYKTDVETSFLVPLGDYGKRDEIKVNKIFPVIWAEEWRNS